MWEPSVVAPTNKSLHPNDPTNNNIDFNSFDSTFKKFRLSTTNLLNPYQLRTKTAPIKERIIEENDPPNLKLRPNQKTIKVRRFTQPTLKNIPSKTLQANERHGHPIEEPTDNTCRVLLNNIIGI